MRDIKFRMFYNNKMFYMNKMFVAVGHIGFSNDGYVDLNEYDKEDCYLMQYTGLKDKNGKEIWEGDIVITTYDSTHLKDGSKKVEKAVVEWDICNPCFVMKGIDKKNFIEYDFVCCDLRYQEVIGNIYENLELLK